MWDRVKFKESAKQVLGKDLFGKKWLMSALASLIYTLISALPSGVIVLPMSFVWMFNGLIPILTDSGMMEFDSAMFAMGLTVLVFWVVYVIVFTFIYAVILLASLFLTAPLQVGFIRYFLALRDPYDSEAPSLKLIFSCFKKGQYMNVVKSWGMTLLILQLWSLVPFAGIFLYFVKYFQYFYVPYIVADNPDIDRKTATTVSTQMTDGEKGEIFVMELSFIGWELLGGLVTLSGIPVILQWVIPYVQTTYANLYDFAKRRAIGRGVYRPEVFGIYPQGDPQDPYAQPFDINAFYTRNRNYSRGCV